MLKNWKKIRKSLLATFTLMAAIVIVAFSSTAYAAKSYKITFNPNGGSVSSTYKYVTYGNTYGTLPTPSKTGYRFEGWFTAKDGGVEISSNTVMNKENDHTLYAHWKAMKIIITLDPNGGGAVKPAYVAPAYEQKIGNMPVPSRTGYTFAGWSKTQTDEPDYVTASMINRSTRNYTLYARWKKTVSFVTDGGTAVPNRTYLMGTTYGQLPSTSKSGYRFVGWYRDNDKKDSKVYGTDKVYNVNTLYAKWEKVSGTFKAKTCHNSDGKAYTASKHVAKFTVNSSNVRSLRAEVLKVSDYKQKVAALYALDAVGSYYCQEQRNTNGAYDCSSLVSRAYLYAGVSSAFKGLPGSKAILSNLQSLAKNGKAVRVTNGKYKTGDIMFSNDNKHVSIYVGKINGTGYRVAAENHATGVGYFDVSKTSYTNVYRLK